MDHLSALENFNSNLWIFGYGSLCWHPGFEFSRSVIGHVSGFSRKFWQGNTKHRGTESKPGRVATLIEDEKSTVWGRAFEISGDTALTYLTNRECKLGGYMTKFATFYPRETQENNMKPIMVMLYVATPKNDLWLGDAPLCSIADQITECYGNSGHNVEYLLRLASFMRTHVPEADDDHLYTLEHLVLIRIKERKMCIKTLMGDSLRTFESANNENGPAERDQLQEAGAVALERVDSFQYTARVPQKNLRCLHK